MHGVPQNVERQPPWNDFATQVRAQGDQRA